MPSIKDHESKKKKKHAHSGAHAGSHSKKQGNGHQNERLHADEVEQEDTVEAFVAETEVKVSSKRRPSQLDADAIETKGSAVDESANVAGDSNSDHADVNPESFQSFSEPEKFELNFPGSFLIKSKAPKAFELAERVAGDWINDGKFESLPVGHPLAQILAAKVLTKAKDVEKKALNSTPVTLAKIGLEYAKSKIKR